MPDPIQILGNGIAACCCARLLSRAGYSVFADYQPRAASPVLMLSLQTQKLILDVFDDEHLFNGALPISKRIVVWGNQLEPVTLPHSGLVISEATLLERLWRNINLQGRSSAGAAWSVLTGKFALPPVVTHEFGNRIASTHSVKLINTAALKSCWVEAVNSGWLFLIPCGENRGSLISVGSDPSTLLSESRLVCEQIEMANLSTGSFWAHPRIVMPLSSDGWIACGSAAVTFDPIAGEGTGNAIREGILASAVIRAAGEGGGETGDLHNHYANRILSGFLRHLQTCCSFYQSVASPWWAGELESLLRGVEWAREELCARPTSLYRLIGFQLQRLT